MKKIIGLGIAVAVIIALVTTGTFALFSDTEESTGNVFTAGTIDLKVGDADPWTAKVDGTLKDVKPCEVRWVTITLENVGENPMDVWKHIEVTAVADGLHPESEDEEDPDDDVLQPEDQHNGEDVPSLEEDAVKRDQVRRHQHGHRRGQP